LAGQFPRIREERSGHPEPNAIQADVIGWTPLSKSGHDSLKGL
jgi:hypothetical protein